MMKCYQLAFKYIERYKPSPNPTTPLCAVRASSTEISCQTLSSYPVCLSLSSPLCQVAHSLTPTSTAPFLTHCPPTLSLPVLHPISLSFITTLSPMSSLLSFYPSLHVFCSLPLFIVPTLLLQFSLILFIGRYLNTDRERINITYLILFIQSFHLSWKMCKFLFQI